jgi:predicted ATPase/class 3 adenylate cyclase
LSQPTATFTFLFTDIQGSTKLWEQFPAEMGRVLARHDALLADAVTAADGRVFKHVGDACCAAFQTAPAALRAALEAQLALGAESWPSEIRIEVRMAVHTGAAEIRDADYFGQSLNRVARLLAIGHGGQVLLSDVAQQLCLDHLPAEATLKSLGDHRLKDLGRPEHVYQLLHPLLRAEFPELNSLGGMPSNLPQQLTSFIGRDKELGDVARLLSEGRLVTLTGSGGAGKTRLSLQVAADALDSFERGVWLVELAPVSDPEIVPQVVAGVLDVSEAKGKTILESLIENVGKKRLLLILDNCEHLLDACAQLASAILQRCPNVAILATSREALGVPGEVSYRVPSLSFPDLKEAPTATSLSLFDSVRLFIDRARNHLPSFAVTDQNAPALASVCHRLDGIPFAIELAAARVRSMSVDEINRRLDQRFSLLTGGYRTLLPRQQTLRSLIDWSYDLLSEPEQKLLDHLSVFWGGWDVDGAEHVCAVDVDRRDVLGLLLALVDKSLVVAEEREGATRYRLLQTVREYAAERLGDEGRETLSVRHLEYFRALAVEREPDFRSAKQQEWMGRLDAEHDNIRAALRRAIEEGHNAAAGFDLAGSIWRFWYIRGFLAEGLGWLSQVERFEGIGQAIQAKVLNGLGVLAWTRGDFASAEAFHERALALHRELGDRRGVAVSANNLGILFSDAGDYEKAEELFAQSVVVMRELGDQYGLASLLNAQAIAAFYTGRNEEAQVLYEESIAIKRKIGDRHGLAMTLINLGLFWEDAGQMERARPLLDEAAELYRDMGDHKGSVLCEGARGLLLLSDGDIAGATACFLENLDTSIEDGMKFFVASSLEGMAEVAIALGQARRSSLLWGYAAKIREELGTPKAPPVARRQTKSLAKVREVAGDSFKAWFAEGQGLTLEAALSLAREG